MIRSLVLLACALLLSLTDVMASSNPIPGVGIVVKRNPGSSTARTTTDKDGNFRIEGLEPGTYSIEVMQPDVDKYFASSGTATATKKGIGEGSGDDGAVTTASSRSSGTVAGGITGGAVAGKAYAEICVTSCDQVTLDGATKKAGSNKFYEAGGTMLVTVMADGVISGQLRAGISTSRSNLRTK